MKLVFIGYMGSGKSAVAREVRNQLGMQLVDLDAFIETKEGMSISQLFAEKGEVYFRAKEISYLEELLNSKEDLLISLGGGTPCFGKNMETILEKSIAIYLKASVSTLYQRLQKEKSQRPLIAEIANDQLQEFIAKHLFERISFYERAHHILSVDGKDISQIGKELLERIK